MESKQDQNVIGQALHLIVPCVASGPSCSDETWTPNGLAVSILKALLVVVALMASLLGRLCSVLGAVFTHFMCFGFQISYGLCTFSFTLIESHTGLSVAHCLDSWVFLLKPRCNASRSHNSQISKAPKSSTTQRHQYLLPSGAKAEPFLMLLVVQEAFDCMDD